MACRARAAAVPAWAMYWLLERQCRGSGYQLPEGVDSPGDGPPSDFRLIGSGLVLSATDEWPSELLAKVRLTAQLSPGVAG